MIALRIVLLFGCVFAPLEVTAQNLQGHASETPGSTRPGSINESVSAEKLKRLLEHPELNDKDRDAIARAVQRHPGILVATAIPPLTPELTTLQRADAPYADTEHIEELKDRIALIALSEGYVKFEPNEFISADRLVHAATSPGDVRLGIRETDLRLAYAAFQEGILAVPPLCEDGRPRRFPDGSRQCIGDNPYDIGLFAAVVPIFFDNVLICTGVLLDRMTIVTAAHCLVSISEAEKDTPLPLFPAERLSTRLPHVDTPVPVRNPRVAPEWQCAFGQRNCPDYAFDFGFLSYDAQRAPSSLQYPTLTAPSDAARLDVTFVGYGRSTVPPQPWSNKPTVGIQTILIGQNGDRFMWEFDFRDEAGSTICNGDSGGPIFLGNPRQLGDPLRLIGLVSSTATIEVVPSPHYPDVSDCLVTESQAVNIAGQKVKSRICNLHSDPQFCG